MTKDNINPDHYAVGGMQPWEYMKIKSSPEEFCGFLRLTALKYLSRFGHKDNKLQEVLKAKWYIDKLVEELQTEERPKKSIPTKPGTGIIKP
jgi:hypothetical protein